MLVVLFRFLVVYLFDLVVDILDFLGVLLSFCVFGVKVALELGNQEQVV